MITRERMLNIIEDATNLNVKADAGEVLGWMGDNRDLEEFVKINGGEYTLKKENGRTYRIFIEKDFEIGKYPVTNQWYQKFIDDKGYENKEYWSLEGSQWLKESGAKSPDINYWHDKKWKCPNAPVVGVSWYEADAFCRWLTLTRKDGYNYRLPAKDEWQAAAAGKEGREYPWGDWQEDRCNYDGANIGKTSPVGIFLKGFTPDTGIADLSGNVWEWTDSWYDEKTKDTKVLCGGSWCDNKISACCAYSSSGSPNFRLIGRGFRCSRRFL